MDPTTLRLIQGAAGAAKSATYVDDVFSAFVYDGNGSTSHSINNGIDISGEGGMVWFARRDSGAYKPLFDTERGATKALYSNDAMSEDTASTDLTAFNSNGFTVAQGATVNASGGDYVSWTFRKAPGFFDIVTYTGNGSNRAIAHNLGSKPGFMIIKSLDSSSYWRTYNQARGATKSIVLNENFAENTFSQIFNDTEPTATHFTVGTHDTVNKSGDNFVAYLFGHNDQSFGTDSDEAIINCGSYAGNGSTGQTINLGFEPQWVIVKCYTHGGTGYGWSMLDIMRQRTIEANTSSGEFSNKRMTPRPNGFHLDVGDSDLNESGKSYVYIAIRRPNKPPTAGTEVFTPTFQSMGSNMTTGFPVDLLFNKPNITGTNNYAVDRIRGPRSTFVTDNGNAEYTGWSQDAFPLDNNTGVDAPYWGSASDTGTTHLFRRAPGFLDILEYNGNSAARNINHNLEATPELVIIKSSSLGESWIVNSTHFTTQTSQYTNLNTNSALVSVANFFATPTSTTFGFGSGAPSEGSINRSGETYIAYLFATLAGISKVGTYSGTGSDVDVDCGFSAGARYVLIKRTDSTGDWYVFDSAMGITSGNVYYWFYNTNGAVVTTTDYIDPLNSGFTVTSSAPAELNASGGTYLFLAVA